MAARDLVENARLAAPGRVQRRSSACSSTARSRRRFLPRRLARCVASGVELRGDDDGRARSPAAVPVAPATDDDWAAEFLALILAVAVVDGRSTRRSTHIARVRLEPHRGHRAPRDERRRAALRARGATVERVLVNASTRFNDGGELGLGAEIGISTTRLHAYGPMGLEELTAQKFVVDGEGQVR